MNNELRCFTDTQQDTKCEVQDELEFVEAWDMEKITIGSDFGLNGAIFKNGDFFNTILGRFFHVRLPPNPRKGTGHYVPWHRTFCPMPTLYIKENIKRKKRTCYGMRKKVVLT